MRYFPEHHQPLPSLRARKRIATMRHVQTVAVELMDERGFDSVTVEEVAAAAEVSPSTIYRHFHTKEGLVLHDEADDITRAELVERITATTSSQELADVIRTSVEEMAVSTTALEPALMSARLRLVRSTPQLQDATVAMADEWAQSIAVALDEAGFGGYVANHVLASAWAHGISAAIYVSEEATPEGLARAMREAATLLKGTLSGLERD